ncbi:MAG: type II toxin-antitoxin system VapC family toxin [Bacteroidetes bacterium]|nr:type II toxin-antitoxin system VapC family toxin [Bacteroidota bacterium]
MELIADTTVLIDLWRFRDKPSRIADLVQKVGEGSLIVPWITQAEFSRGALFKGVTLPSLASFYSSFLLLALDQKTMDRYCELWVEMARRGKAPDYPDLWIAAAACARNTPLITRNPKHFDGMPGLEVIGYALKTS